MKIGDCIAWCSIRPYPFFSTLIKLFTGPVGHISTYLGDNIIVEAVEEGLKLNELDERINNSAPFSTVWWLPLSEESRAKLDERALLDYYYQKLGTEYDLRQAIKSGLKRQYNEPCDKRLFCSESYLFGMLAGKVINSCNPSEAPPTDVTRMKLFDDYKIIKGWRKLRKLGTIEPEGYGFRPNIMGTLSVRSCNR